MNIEQQNPRYKIDDNKNNGSFICWDLLNILVISILYGVGKDKVCNQDIKSLVLAYIIIKACLVAVRLVLCGIRMWSVLASVIITLIFTFTWILGMCTYYIISLVYFFNSDNNWLDNATLIWVAMLLIVIEGISMLVVLPILLCCTICVIPATILAAKA